MLMLGMLACSHEGADAGWLWPSIDGPMKGPLPVGRGHVGAIIRDIGHDHAREVGCDHPLTAVAMKGPLPVDCGHPLMTAV